MRPRPTPLARLRLTALPSAALLTLALLPSAVRAEPGTPLTLVGPTGEHVVQSQTLDGELYLSLRDLATALGGTLRFADRDRQGVLAWGGHQVWVSAGERRVEVNDRRVRLSDDVESAGTGPTEAGFWVPRDFFDRVIVPLAGTTWTMRAGAPAPPAAATGMPPGTPAAPPPEAWALRASREPGLVRTIVLDPGHGGAEDGAKGPSGLLEKDVVLDLAHRLEARLRGAGYVVLLTRSADTDVGLADRTALANHHHADLFISLHANASPSLEARGAETYYLSLNRVPRPPGVGEDEGWGHEESVDSGKATGGRDDRDPLKMVLWDMAQSTSLEESAAFAEAVQTELNQALGLENRGVRQAPFRVLVGALMPAVLVEIGFISNAEEEERLRQSAVLDRLAETLARAVDGYRERLRVRGTGSDVGWKSGGPGDR